MLKVLGSFRLTLVLAVAIAFLFVINPHYQPPSSAPVRTNGGPSQAVLAVATNIPEQASSTSASTQSDAANKNGTQSVPASDTFQTAQTLQPIAQPNDSDSQTQSPINVSPQSDPLPAVQQVAAPVTQQVKKVASSVTKPICVNTKLLSLNLDTCLRI